MGRWFKNLNVEPCKCYFRVAMFHIWALYLPYIVLPYIRVLTNVLKGLKMSSIDFSIFKALKSLKFGHFFDLRS